MYTLNILQNSPFSAPLVLIPSILMALLVIYVFFRIFQSIFKRINSISNELSCNKKSAFLWWLFTPIITPLLLIFKALRPVLIFIKPYTKEVIYFFIGIFRILKGVILGIVHLGRGSASREGEAISTLDRLERSTVHLYRSYANRHGVSPSNKMTDSEILDVAKRVQSSFVSASNQRGERITGAHLMTINIKFFQVYEKLGGDMFSEHLAYEVNSYLKSGLRDDYKQDLGVI